MQVQRDRDQAGRFDSSRNDPCSAHPCPHSLERLQSTHHLRSLDHSAENCVGPSQWPGQQTSGLRSQNCHRKCGNGRHWTGPKETRLPCAFKPGVHCRFPCFTGLHSQRVCRQSYNCALRAGLQACFPDLSEQQSDCSVARLSRLLSNSRHPAFRVSSKQTQFG